MTNSVRNETTLELGTTKIPMRGSLGCLKSIEGKTGKTIPRLVRAIQSNDLSIVDTITILLEGAKAAEHPMVEEDVIILIEDNGIAVVQFALGDFFTVALYGGPLAEEESKKKTETTIA